MKIELNMYSPMSTLRANFVFATVVLFYLCICKQSNAQQKKEVTVPATVSASLAKSYPQAEEIKWDQKKEGYKAKFKIKKRTHEIWLNSDGKIIKKEIEIRELDLSPRVLDAIKVQYPSYKVDHCDRIEEGATTSFKVELKNEKDKKKLHFTEDGKLIPKAEKDE